MLCFLFTDKALQANCNERTRNIDTQTELKIGDSNKQTQTRNFSQVCFDIVDASNNSIKEEIVSCSFEDNLSDLLPKVFKETDQIIEDFGLKYQYIRSYFRDGSLYHYTEQFISSSLSTEIRSNREFVHADGEVKDDRDYSGVTSYFIEDLDDISVSAESVPIITIEYTSLVMELNSDEPPTICRATDGIKALADERYIASIECICVSDRERPNSEKFYAISESGELVDMASGDLTTITTEASRFAVGRQKVQRLHLLLRDGSRLPKWPFPAKKGLTIYFREGVIQQRTRLFDIVDGIVKVAAEASSLSKHWTCYKKVPGISHSRMISMCIGINRSSRRQT